VPGTDGTKLVPSVPGSSAAKLGAQVALGAGKEFTVPRPHRVFPADSVLHVVNRGNDRRTLFASSVDYAMFRELLQDLRERLDVPMLAFVLMPNHWHLVLQPHHHTDLSRFLHRLTGIHAKRTREATDTVGEGHVYQGRYRSFALETTRRFLNTIRYVEANPVRAGLVAKAELWPWSSLNERLRELPTLDIGPVTLPMDETWLAMVNAPGPAKPMKSQRRESRDLIGVRT
jgi:putative transposase